MSGTVHFGDCREVMRDLIAQGTQVQTCVTSPPYYALRDYGVDGQLGLEDSLDKYLSNMIEVFSLVADLLADDGTCWVNMGDSYAQSGGPGWQGKNGQRADRRFTHTRDSVPKRDAVRRPGGGLKPKDLMGVPWRMAFALQDAGWYLRQDIIWHKPNPMPESVRDRCTKAHEYIFLLSKSPRYFFDQERIKEKASENTNPRRAKNGAQVPVGWDTRKGEGGHGSFHRGGRRKLEAPGARTKNNDSFDQAMEVMPEYRNKRSVWIVPSEPYAGAHFATFPTALIEPCILAGSRPGDVVLDPFFGSGTTGQVCNQLGRGYIGIELNPEYKALQDERTAQMGLTL